MKFKKHFLIYLVIVSFFTSFTWISRGVGDPRLASPDIEWGVTEGATYTWVVRESNTDLGFLPVGSKYTITIDAIISSGGGEASQIDVTMTRYNSQTQATTTILNNEMFIYFDSATNSISFYGPIYDHGFFMPPDYRYGFIEGLMDYFRNVCGFDSCGYSSQSGSDGHLSPHGTDLSTNLYYLWSFTERTYGYAITEELQIFNYPTFETIYILQLETIIPYGNFFLIFTGLTIVSLIYIYRKKIK